MLYVFSAIAPVRKRQRTGAVQEASRHTEPSKLATAFGLRQSSGAFALNTYQIFNLRYAGACRGEPLKKRNRGEAPVSLNVSLPSLLYWAMRRNSTLVLPVPK